MESKRALVFLIVVIACAGTAHAAAGTCSMAVIAEPFVLPDGTEHAGGRLTLCDRPYNPVQSVLTTYVNGVAAGLFVTHLRHPEGPAEPGDRMIFRRQADGRLRLVAYAVPGARDRGLRSL